MPPTTALLLIEQLDDLLIELLQSLSPADWEVPTVARQWAVKDVAAHLLDGNLRGLSAGRDGYFGEKPVGVNSYEQLVAYLNRLNMDWTRAMRRVSPALLVQLLQITAPLYRQHLQSLPPEAPAVFGVAWAGQHSSPNWLHIAREYTEKFLHQQQIRDALNRPGLLVSAYFTPFMDTCLYALPHTLRAVQAADGTLVCLQITGAVVGQWQVQYWQQSGWQVALHATEPPTTVVRIDADAAWKLISKSWRPADAAPYIQITGNEALGRRALEMVAFMA